MINAQIARVAPAERPALMVRRPGVRAFWMLFAAEALVLAVALGWLLGHLPQLTPLSQTAEVDVLRSAVWSRVDGALDDPVVEVAPGVLVRSSAVRGFELGGVTYHYYFEGRAGYDPLSRGRVTDRQVEVVARDSDGERTLVIYRLLQG
jgi:hypothetical protein